MDFMHIARHSLWNPLEARVTLGSLFILNCLIKLVTIPAIKECHKWLIMSQQLVFTLFIKSNGEPLKELEQGGR